jgi:hypothetical protein
MADGLLSCVMRIATWNLNSLKARCNRPVIIARLDLRRHL